MGDLGDIVTTRVEDIEKDKDIFPADEKADGMDDLDRPMAELEKPDEAIPDSSKTRHDENIYEDELLAEKMEELAEETKQTDISSPPKTKSHNSDKSPKEKKRGKEKSVERREKSVEKIEMEESVSEEKPRKEKKKEKT